MKIIIKNLQKKIPIHPGRIKKAVLRLISCRKRKGFDEITVCFVDDKKITSLNKKFLGKNCSTDVLSFSARSLNNKKHFFGDLAISAETAGRNAILYKTKPDEELTLYVIHGVLHLLGYRDYSSEEKRIMREKESEYLLELCQSRKQKRLY